MIYPPLQELTIRTLDTVLFLIVLAGHIKIVLDARPKASAYRRTILIDGKPVSFEPIKQEVSK